MVDSVEQPEVEVSADEMFNEMWSDPNKGPNLDAVPEPMEEAVPEPAAEDNVAEAVETESEATPSEETTRQSPHQAPVSTRDPYDWIASLPEEQREMAESLKHEALSDRGRVSALTRKVNETAQELAALKAHSTVAPASEEAVTTAPELSESEKLKRLQEDYPELGKQLTDIWAEREATLRQEFTDQLTPIQAARDADAIASDQAKLEQAAADIFNTEETGVYWKDVVQSEDFAAWLDMQPTFIQKTARESNDAQDGIDVLKLYEDDYQAALAAQAAPDPSNSGVDTSQGDKVRAQREQRQATTVSPESRPVGTDTDRISGDYDSTFNAMWGNPK